MFDFCDRGFGLIGVLLHRPDRIYCPQTGCRLIQLLILCQQCVGTDVDVYINLLQDLIDDAKSKEELIVSCQAAHIPLEILLDFVSGDIWTKDELLQWYQEALAEEREKRRASSEGR